MAKFCANCGNQMMDNAVVCPACGAPAEVQAAPAAAENPVASAVKKIDPKYIKIGGIAVAAIVVIAIIIAIIAGGGGYKKALDNYFDYSLKTDIKKVEKIAPKKYWDFCKESGLFNIKDKDELKECYEEHLEEQKEDLEDEYGAKIKYSYKVTKEKDLSKKKLNAIAEYLKENYDIPKKSVKAAKEIDLEIKIKGKEDNDEDEFEGIIVVKIDGAWYVVASEEYPSFMDYKGEYDQEAYADYLEEKNKDDKDEDEE